MKTGIYKRDCRAPLAMTEIRPRHYPLQTCVTFLQAPARGNRGRPYLLTPKTPSTCDILFMRLMICFLLLTSSANSMRAVLSWVEPARA